jgi:choline-glycine betaine transporter
VGGRADRLAALMLLLVGGRDALQWGAIVVTSPFVLVLV